MASNNLTFLYLSEDEVIAAGLTMAEVTDLCTQSLREHGLGEVENPRFTSLALVPQFTVYIASKSLFAQTMLHGN